MRAIADVRVVRRGQLIYCLLARRPACGVIVSVTFLTLCPSPLHQKKLSLFLIVWPFLMSHSY